MKGLAFILKQVQNILFWTNDYYASAIIEVIKGWVG